MSIAEAPIPIEAEELKLNSSNSLLSQLNDAETAILPIVLKYAAEFQICPALILAIIQQESEFRPLVIGDRGRSIGLMQVQFIAAQDAGYVGTKSQWKYEGLDPEKNIETGVKYLVLQYQRYSSSRVYATTIENILSSYNAGQPTLKNEWYVQQTLLGRDGNRGYFFYYLSQLGTGHMSLSGSFPPQEEDIEFLAQFATSSATSSATATATKVIRCGSRSSKMVAITIDDGWSPRLVAEALLILRELDIKCTLFPTGAVLARSPELWRQALADGHELGNHTYTHRPLSSLTDEMIKWEIRMWEKQTSQQTIWFRPPKMSGFDNSTSISKFSPIIRELGYTTVLWTIDTYYGIYKEKGLGVDAATVTDYVAAKVRPGDIILLHFIPPDIAALRGIIRGIRAKGLEPVTLTALLSP